MAVVVNLQTAGVGTSGAAWVDVSSSRAITSADDGALWRCTTALTLTIAAGLSPKPNLIVQPPPSGNLTIAVTGGATINGAASSINRTQASNWSGVGIVSLIGTDAYGVGGA